MAHYKEVYKQNIFNMSLRWFRSVEHPATVGGGGGGWAGGGGGGGGGTLRSSRKNWAELYGCIK